MNTIVEVKLKYDEFVKKINKDNNSSEDLSNQSNIESNLSSIVEILLKKSSTSQTQGEVKNFYKSPVIAMSSDPLLWWKNNSKAYPILFKLSIDHIAMMPTSTSS